MQRESPNLGHHEFPGVYFIRFSLCVWVLVGVAFYEKTLNEMGEERKGGMVD
jgi:hypothetical protein